MPDPTLDGLAPARRTPFGDNPVVGARGARTQRAILAAALEVFAARGYHDAGVEHITEAAGCSRPTFYQYFASKEDLFRTLAAQVARAVVTMTEDVGDIRRDAEGRDVVREWMERFAEHYDRFAPVFTAFTSAVRSDEDLAGDSAVVSAGFAKALRRHLVPARSWGEDVDHDVVASVTMTMIVRANLLRIGTAGLVGRRRFVDSLAALVHRVLVGPVGALDAPAPRPSRLPVRLRATVPGPNGAPGAGTDGLTAQGRRMRDRLLAAGLEVFPRLGFHDTRVDDVAEAAGASHGSFYRYFESKEHLFGEIASQAAADLVACMDALPLAGRPAALRSWLDEWFDVYDRHGAVVGLWREMEFTDPVVEAVTRQVADAVTGRLYRLLDENGVGDPLVNALALVGLLETVPHHVARFGYFERDAAIPALAAVIRRGVLGRN